MAVTQIDLDDEALAEVMRISGVKTKKEAVNLALREYVAAERRIEALERAAGYAKDWDYEGWKRMHEAEKDPDIASKKHKAAKNDTAA